MTTEHVSVPRDEFEKWMIEEMGYPRADLYFASARNCYRSYHVHLAWKAWEQAILSRATPSEGLVKLTVKTRNPSKYTLHDHETGDVWKGTKSGGWVRSKPSAPRVVSDEDVERAEEILIARGWEIVDEEIFESDVRAAPESFATSLPAAVPDGLIKRLKEISEWETTGVLCDGELRKDARELSARFGQSHFATIDMAKRDAWKQAADFLLAAAPQAGERG
ncbi:hypothetical protein CH75_06255 [Dyella jiangningensis]|nr:hypothetical protein CH75_06255 [Dyella jiangningensis]